MSYIRTDEIRKKQRKSIKKSYSSGEYDMEARVTSYKKTLEAKRELGESIGRKSKADGGVYKRSGIDLPCPVCGTLVYHRKKELDENKRKCCSRDCLYKNPERIEMLKNIDRSYMYEQDYIDKMSSTHTKEYMKYYRKVRKISERNYVLFKDEINPNDFPRTLCGVEGGYQLDHIKSLKDCWYENVDVEIAGGKENLQIIPWKENLNKRKFDNLLK